MGGPDERQVPQSFMTTHFLPDLHAISAWITFLHAGQIIFSGTVEDFLNQSDTHSVDEAFAWFVNQAESEDDDQAESFQPSSRRE